jgi:cell pole-organizing protein PopZ
MTITNGANNHTVEDLLSSIRTSMGEDHTPMRAGPSVPLARRESSRTEDTAEFELPAIFKPGHNTPVEKPANLFGRLSDALKPAAAAEPDRSRTVIRFEPAGGRMIEPPPAKPATQMSRPGQQSDPAESVAKENSTVKREMPSFFDQRLNKLGEMTRHAYTPKPVEQPKPIAPQQLVPQPQPQPPPLRQQASGEGGGAMEDAAAQLLRPILKQWLTENMPKIVEKALRSEAGEEFPSSPVPGLRKPGQ